MKIQSLSCLVLILLLSACYDDFDESKEIIIIDEPETFVDANLVGHVLDLDEENIFEYTLKINGNSYTPKNGLINVALNFVNELSQSVYVVTDDGRDAFVNMALLRNDINYAEINLFPAHTIKEVKNENEIIINIENDVNLRLTKNQFINHTNPSQLAIHHRTLSNRKLANQIGHRAFNKLSVESVIEIEKVVHYTFGDPTIGNIELNAGQSIPLQINNIDQPLASKALFRYSEEDEYWIWEADVTATNQEFVLNRDGYFAIAQHFPSVVAQSKMTIDNKPIAFQSFNITTDLLELEGRTTSSGNWIALVPKSDELEIELLNDCDETISKFNLQTETEDILFEGQDLVDIKDAYLRLNMIILDCNGEVDNTSVIIIDDISGTHFFAFGDSELDVWVPICSDQISISVSDEETGESGPTINWNNSIDDNISFLINCEEFEDGFSFIKINNEERTFNSFDFEYDGEKTTLKSKDNNIRFSFTGNEAGDYGETDTHIFINDMFGDKGYYISCENSELGCGISECTVTHYGTNEGEWTRVTFSGRLWMQTIDPPVASYHNIEGLIMVRK